MVLANRNPNNLTHALEQRRAFGRVPPSWLPLCPTQALARDLVKELELKGHRGCVNTVAWSDDGTMLVSSGDDHDVRIWPVESGLTTCHSVTKTRHTGNVFCARFVPNTCNRNVVSCARDGDIRLTDVETNALHVITSYKPASVHKLQFLPHAPSVFLSAGGDGTVRYFDLRADVGRIRNRDESNIVVDLRRPTLHNTIELNAISVCPVHGHLLAAAGGDPFVRIYDLRKPIVPSLGSPLVMDCVTRFVPQGMEDNQTMHLTGCQFNFNGTRVVGTYSCGNIFIFDTTRVDVDAVKLQPDSAITIASGRVQHVAARKAALQSASREEEEEEANPEEEDDEETQLRSALGSHVPFMRPPVNGTQAQLRCEQGVMRHNVLNELKGHINVKTVKEVTFFGPRSECVMSGSDDGTIFVWDAASGEPLAVLEDADQMTVNCIAPNPENPFIVASSGIDKDVKIWSPVGRTGANANEAAIKKRIEHNNARNSRPQRPGFGNINMITLYQLAQLNPDIAQFFAMLANGGDDDDDDEEEGEEEDTTMDTDDDE